jgi:hypothetical protein
MASIPSSRDQDLAPVVSAHLSALDGSSSVLDAARLVFSRYAPAARVGGARVGGAPRALCGDFDPATGVYRVSVDGHFVVRASLLLHAAAAARICSRVAVIIAHARGDFERAEQLPSGGSVALLLHLRRGDCVSVQLLPRPEIEREPQATTTEPSLREPDEPTVVQFSVELAMRKRKRESSSDEDDASKRSLARAPRAARAGAGSGTSSDTDWSEGFSSDDSAHVAALPPACVRRITRRLRTSQPPGL